MWESIKLLLLRLFGAKAVCSDSQIKRNKDDDIAYANQSGINIVSIIANRLAVLTTTESTVRVAGNGQEQRVKELNRLLNAVWSKSSMITARAYGTGGVLLLPYVVCGRIYTAVVPKDRFYITDLCGTDIKAASVLADAVEINGYRYLRFTDYSLQGSDFLIRNRAVCDNKVINLRAVSEWKGIDEEICITNVNRPLFSYLKCPCSRLDTDTLYGSPVTRGSEDIIRQINECLKQIETEYRHKQIKVFADSTMFDKDETVDRTLFKKFLMGGDLKKESLFEVFDPAFRDAGYYNRLNALFELLEKSIGTSRGILTESKSEGATATEIKRSCIDTYSIVNLMRNNWEKAAEELAYAYNVLCNVCKIGSESREEYKISWDWGYLMVENSSETWQQLLDGVSQGAISVTELRQFLYPNESREQAEMEVQRIKKQSPALKNLYGE